MESSELTDPMKGRTIMAIGVEAVALENELPTFDLTGRKAFVTGSSRGIGRAVALALAQRGGGCRHQLQHRRRSGRIVCEAIRGMGRKAQYYAHNVALETEIEAMCAEVKRDFGTIDILVNNAAINRDRTFKRLTKEAWDEVITTDLTSVFLITKQFIDEMADRGWGRIINMSSMSGEIGTVRPGELRRRESRPDWPDQDARPGIRPQGSDRQRRRARVHENPDDRRHPR